MQAMRPHLGYVTSTRFMREMMVPPKVPFTPAGLVQLVMTRAAVDLLPDDIQDLYGFRWTWSQPPAGAPGFGPDHEERPGQSELQQHGHRAAQANGCARVRRRRQEAACQTAGLNQLGGLPLDHFVRQRDGSLRSVCTRARLHQSQLPQLRSYLLRFQQLKTTLQQRDFLASQVTCQAMSAQREVRANQARFQTCLQAFQVTISHTGDFGAERTQRTVNQRIGAPAAREWRSFAGSWALLTSRQFRESDRSKPGHGQSFNVSKLYNKRCLLSP